MTIPESQLVTWSHQGSISGSRDTYQTIKRVLEAGGTPYSNKNYQIYLQGSYGNDTNIFSESDVDIVIQLDDCIQYDIKELSEVEKYAWKHLFPDATYTYNDFKKDVLIVLVNNFGNDVELGSKAIRIIANGNRRKADVISAIQYRRYHKFNSLDDQLFDEGIGFYNGAGQLIVNYPKLHSPNLTKKHQNSNGKLKPMIRIIKNIRTKLVEDGHLNSGTAPSYFLEGLLYNVPGEKFTSSYQDCFINAFTWIQRDAKKEKLVCANEQYLLLWEDSLVCWPKNDCEAFLDAAINLWNKW